MTQQLHYGQTNTIGEDCTDIDINADTAVDKILNRASLDWEVHTQDGLGPGWDYAGETPRFSYRWVEETDDDGLPTGRMTKLLLGQATVRRKVFQNRDVFEAIVGFCKANNLPVLRAGNLDRGVRQFAICGVNDGFELPEGDKVNAQVLVTHSHAVGSLNFSILTERLICTNQLVLPNWVKQVRLKHTQSFFARDAIAKLEDLRQGIDQYEAQARALTDRSIKTRDLSGDSYKAAQAWVVENLGYPDRPLKDQPRYLQQMLGGDDMLAQAIALKSAMKSGSRLQTPEEGTPDDLDIEQLPAAFQDIMNAYQHAPGAELQTAFNTTWGALNAVTYHYTHNTAQRGGVSGHFSSLWQGNKAQTTQHALKQAQAVAGLVG